MKKECAYTRKRLSRYLAGHLFLPQRRRIERHLAACPVCSSEFDAVRRIDETQRILRDFAPAEGLVRAGAASIVALRRLLFRPLWLVLIVAAAVASYVYVIHPLLHDPDLERLDASVPAASAPAAPHAHGQSLSTATATAQEPKKAMLPNAATATAPSPLLITITVEKGKEKASIRRINDAMKEHGQLHSTRFGDSVREISGTLTAGELSALFNRIEGLGKVSYKRSRLASASEGDPIPFIMRLKTFSAAPRPGEEQAGENPVERSVEKPVETPVERPVQTDSGPSQQTSPGQ